MYSWRYIRWRSEQSAQEEEQKMTFEQRDGRQYRIFRAGQAFEQGTVTASESFAYE